MRWTPRAVNASLSASTEERVAASGSNGLSSQGNFGDFEEGIEVNDEVAHQRDQGDFGRFAPRAQPLVASA
jgi:hypothetical protein